MKDSLILFLKVNSGKAAYTVFALYGWISALILSSLLEGYVKLAELDVDVENSVGSVVCRSATDHVVSDVAASQLARRASEAYRMHVRGEHNRQWSDGL
ncbi:hypothetical protein BaRGS_00014797 [Batillaria attramentaria]|uniref:Uncharacterized protein n=1 Tax=Batillaria attramentaria TaxID=370345 RepID=A0ABD0L459_9CAEN